MNNISAIGRITKDIELKTTTTGKELVNFTVAVNRNFKNSQGEYEADFISCIAFGNTAKFMNNYLNKGALVGITGRIQTGKYDNKDGITVYTTDLIVNTIQPLEKKQDKQPQDFMSQIVEEKTIQNDELPF